MSNGPIAAGYSTELLLSHYRNVEESSRFWVGGWRGVCRFQKGIRQRISRNLREEAQEQFWLRGKSPGMGKKLHEQKETIHNCKRQCLHQAADKVWHAAGIGARPHLIRSLH